MNEGEKLIWASAFAAEMKRGYSLTTVVNSAFYAVDLARIAAKQTDDGVLPEAAMMLREMIGASSECPACNGAGIVALGGLSHNCITCNGAGRVVERA